MGLHVIHTKKISESLVIFIIILVFLLRNARAVAGAVWRIAWRRRRVLRTSRRIVRTGRRVLRTGRRIVR